jgi:hypothetical protein
MDSDHIAQTVHRIATNPATVHTGEIDLRHPRDEPSF